MCCWKRVFAMTTAFSWQNCYPLPCFILYSKVRFACYSRYLLISYFCIPISYHEKEIFFCVRRCGLSGGSAGRESACNAGDLGSIPGLGRSPGEGNSYPLLYSGLENSMDCVVHGVTKSQTGMQTLSCDMWDLVLNQGPLHWECRV